MHAFDRRTDGQTNRQTEFPSLYRNCIPCSAVKIKCHVFYGSRCIYYMICNILWCIISIVSVCLKTVYGIRIIYIQIIILANAKPYNIYTVWVKKLAPLKLFAILSLMVNLCNLKLLSYRPNTVLRLHQFWSIYLNICAKCIIFNDEIPQILRIQFSWLRNS